MKRWFLYIVECSDKSLYTGITTDLKRRVTEHNLGIGAKSVRGKLPVKLVYSEEFEKQTSVRKREAVIKTWTREYKIKLITRGLPSKLI